MLRGEHNACTQGFCIGAEDLSMSARRGATIRFRARTISCYVAPEGYAALR